jgi:CBS domain-containing protein
MKIREMLKATGFKSKALITVGPDEFVSAAIQKLIENNKGALPVCNDKDEFVWNYH